MSSKDPAEKPTEAATAEDLTEEPHEDKSLLQHKSAVGAPAPIVDAPPDIYYAVFIVFVLHGIGILLPWNMFINAMDYFVNYKLNTNSSRDADYRNNFMNYISLSAQLPNIIMMAFNVFFQSTRAKLESGSDIRKLIIVIIIEIFVCVVTIALAAINSYDWPGVFFGITIFCIVILNCCSGLYQSSTYGMAAILPMEYSNAVVLGNNVCGTLIALVNIASKAASSRNLKLTAVLYFSAAVLLLVVCIVSLVILPRLKFYRHFGAKRVDLPLEHQNPISDQGTLLENEPVQEDQPAVEATGTSYADLNQRLVH